MFARRSLLLLLWVVLATSETSYGHSGGLDANGCHAGSKPYHCHRASSEMVGNRLRCDLGSRSKDCVDSPVRQVASSSSQPTKTSVPSEKPASSYQREFVAGSYKFKIKNGRCHDGKWIADGINMGDIGTSWNWTIHTVDADGDPLDSFNSSYSFAPKERHTISLGISCRVDWNELKMRFW